MRLLLLTACLFAQQGTLEDAMRLASQGRLAESRTILDGLVKAEPKDADLRYRLGLVLLKQEQLTDAVHELEQAVALQPDFVFGWLAVGDAHFRVGDRAAGLRDAGKAERLAGESAVAWKGLAVLRGRLGDGQGEATALENLMRLAPGDQGAYTRLANLLIEHRNVQDAERIAALGLKRFPGQAELLRLRGLACYGAGRKDEAITSFLAAMDAAPGNDLVHSSIETLLADAGERLPAVVERLRRYRARRGEIPLGSYLLALVSNGEEKTKLLREALAIDRTFWPGWFELHRALLAAGDLKGAMEALRTTIELKPDHELAHFALAELYLASGDREKAREHRALHHKLRASAVVVVTPAAVKLRLP